MYLSSVEMEEKKRKRRDSSSSNQSSISSQVSAAVSTAPSCVSMKSDGSMFPPLNFGLEETQRQLTGEPSSCSVCKEVLKDLVQFFCGHWSCKQCVSLDWDQSDSPADHPCHNCRKKFKKDHQQHENKDFKKAARKKYALTFEGIGEQESSLKGIYTSLYVTAGESGRPDAEHEFRHLKHKFKMCPSSEQLVNLSDIFKPGQEKPHRTVLTKGIAGIGKSFAVQKFILDWAKEEANQDIGFVFSLAFREMNLITDKKSLHELLTIFHPALRSLKDSEVFVKGRIIVILDGLDESRLQLDFENVKSVTTISEVTSVGNLLANLIRGKLLPNAHIWITSRPAAANQIPAQYVDMVTEIRGFNDPQKEEYFRRRFSHNLGLADRINSHIRSSQTLDIMCKIPIFCWISAILFQEFFGGDEETECPQTLTEMMAHFLFAQTKRRSRKYDKKTEKSKERLLKTHREFLLKLGKLAFVQLLKNNLIFYEEDFEECGIDIKEASVYSGFCTAILQEEKVFSQKKVFYFVHLTIQEFFAAIFVYDCFTNKNTTELGNFLDLKQKDHSLLDLLKMTVDKVLEKKNGHLDFFMRFLLGLMAESNRRVIQGLLTSPDPSQDTDKKILTHLKAIRRKTLSPDSCINLFQAMVEMRDYKVKDDIQEYLTLSDHSQTELTPLHCSAVAYMLQVSKNDLDLLDLKSYNTSDEGRRRLIPAVRSSRKAILADCKVTPEWIEHLAFALKFSFSALRDLDLSNNDLKDSGVELLCDGLRNPCCQLETLRLSGCQVTETGCGFLMSALMSNPSHLVELELSYNYPGDSGVKQLSDLRNNPQYKLSMLSVEHGGSHRMKPGFKKYACELTLDPNTTHKNLRLSEGNRKVTWVDEEPPYRRRLEMFDLCQTVLCTQSLSERCYWEVEVFGSLSIGVTYSGNDKKGNMDDFRVGHDDRSWCLVNSTDGYYVLHSNKKVDVSSLGWRTSRVGVYLDWPAGTLSFYRVSSESLNHLYTFKTTFSEPLYPALELQTQSSAIFCQLS